jgi:DNA topoisomerase VI subunit B
MIISDLPDIFRTITLALQAALRKARGWMGKRKQREAAARRKGIFELYSPLIATSLATMTEKDEEEINEMIRSRLQK